MDAPSSSGGLSSKAAASFSRKHVLPPLMPARLFREPAVQQGVQASSLPEQELSTFLSSACNSEALGSRHSQNSLQLFKGAANAVKLGVKASQGFATLRDMGGAAVNPADLQPVRKLGQGAFAVVEEAIYTPSASSTPVPAVECGDARQGGSHQGYSAAAAATAPAAAAGGAGAATAVGGGPAARPASASVGSSVRRRVAVKRLKPELVDQEGNLESFVKEVALLRKLAHKSVVQFIGMGSADASSDESRRRSLFLVQEFMDGGTLKRLVSRQMVDVSRQLYSYPDAFRWALQIAEGLEYLHGARPMVIHRDLKLENILLKGTDPRVADAKIADFGLVALVKPRDRGLHERLLEAEAATLAAASGSRVSFRRLMSLRRKAQTVQELWDQSYRLALSHRWRSSPPPQQLSGRTGSYMYMAPEMYRKDKYNEKVDVFSYGVVVFELLSRYQMVCAVSLAGTEADIESYAAKVSAGYRPPLPPAWPQPVRELIAACWHQEPAQRPGMSWVRERLVTLLAEGVPEEMQNSIRPPPACACTVM